MQLKRTVGQTIGGLWGDEANGDKHDIAVARVADFDYRTLTVSAAPTVRNVPHRLQHDRLLRTGDLLIEKSGGGEQQNVGRVVRWTHGFPAITSNFVNVLRPARGFASAYLVYVHRHLYATGYAAAATKQTTGIQNLDLAAYLRAEIQVPDRARQAQVAEFLDRECGRIAGLVTELNAIRKASRERHDTVREAALMSLRGEHPLRKLSWDVQLTGGFAFKSEEFVHDSSVGVRLLRGTNVTPKGTRWKDVVYWPSERVGEAERFSLKKGDLVVGLNRPWVDGGLRVAIISAADLPALLLQRVGCIRPRLPSALDVDYLRLWLQTDHFRQDVGDASAVTFPMLEPARLLAYRIPVPPLQTQSSTTADARAQSASLEAIETEIDGLNTALGHYRDALITEAVTGQLDVSRLGESRMEESLAAAREGEQPEVLAR